MPLEKPEENSFTVVFFGGANVGITSLVEREAFDFTAEYEWGIGIEAYQETVQVGDKRIKLVMFEMGKEKAFDHISNNIRKGTAGVVMVFDVTNRRSLDEVVSIHGRLKDKLMGVPLLLVANKTDLVDKREIGPVEGKRAAISMNGKYMETSVVENKNVDNLFHTIASMILASRGP